MESLKWDHDTLASDALDRLMAGKGIRGDFYSALERGQTSDPVLRRFWLSIDPVPSWVDWNRVRQGQLVFKRYATAFLVGFAFQGFVGEISAALGPAEVLVRSGGLSGGNIFARLSATLQWLQEVTESPEALQRGGKGFVSTVRVRLRHAEVRKRITEISASQPGYFDTSEHGVPINTYDSILTLTFFCCTPIWKQLPRLGVHLSRREKQDFLAFYRVVAHLLGVPTEYFSSVARAKMTMDSLSTLEANPSESSRKITSTFIHAITDRPPYYMSRSFVLAGIWMTNPASICEALHLEKPRWHSSAALLGLRWTVASVSSMHRVGLHLRLDAGVFTYIQNALSSLEASVPRDRARSARYDMAYAPAFPRKSAAKRMARPGRQNVPFIIKRRNEVVLLLLFGFWCTTAVSLAILVTSLIIRVTM
ncbi:hypothetical protein Q7P37_009908 [Cladosporium fusiforme]